MQVTITIDLDQDDADSIVCALDTIANAIADHGYTDNEPTHTLAQANGAVYRYCVSRVGGR